MTNISDLSICNFGIDEAFKAWKKDWSGNVDGNGDLECYLVARLDKSVRISKAINRIRQEAQDLRLAHLKKESELHAQLSAIQEDCDHSIQRYHGDASGNNDSYHECLICGAYLP